MTSLKNSKSTNNPVAKAPLQGRILRPSCFMLASCADWTIQACRQTYSARGDASAIAELRKEFNRTLSIVRSKQNQILVREAIIARENRSYVAMEDWVCRAQKQYGSP